MARSYRVEYPQNRCMNLNRELMIYSDLKSPWNPFTPLPENSRIVRTPQQRRRRAADNCGTVDLVAPGASEGWDEDATGRDGRGGLARVWGCVCVRKCT